MHPETMCTPVSSPALDEQHSLAIGTLRIQKEYEEATTIRHRKQLGQVFTPPRVAEFMAGLFTKIPSHWRVVDPGAGTGALATALCQRVLRMRAPREIDIHLFESDLDVLPFLERTMTRCERELTKAGHKLSVEIHTNDFVLSQSHRCGQADLFHVQPSVGEFDAVIMNPPYYKIARDSEYAKVMDNVVHGQPNIYVLFLAAAIDALRKNGEMVAITPRSFCNGLYFRAFREWLLERVSIKHIHLFESRKDTFKEAGILQENLITCIQKSSEGADVRISTSYGADIPNRPKAHVYPYQLIVDSSTNERFIRIPESQLDGDVIRFIEKWPCRFHDVQLRVSTGPVVAFRAREYLLDHLSAKTDIPLYSVHNIRWFEAKWPMSRKGKPTAFRINNNSQHLTLPVQNYVLMRRFTAKEEKRRLVAGCFLRRTYPYQMAAFENHVNYIYHADRELTEPETYGIACWLNSALLDAYFRCLSGNTQVNATELRTLPFPGLNTLAEIGEVIVKEGIPSPGHLEELVSQKLGVPRKLSNHLYKGWLL